MRQSVCCPRGDVGSGAGQRPNERAQQRRLQQRELVFPHRDKDFPGPRAVLVGCRRGRKRISAPQIAQDFRETEQTNHHRDKINPARQFRLAESESRRAADTVDADRRKQHPEQGGDDTAQRGSLRDNGGDAEANDSEPEILEVAEPKRKPGQLRRNQDQQCHSDRPAKAGAVKIEHQRQLPPALFGHLMTIQRSRGRGRRSGDSEVNGRDIACKDRRKADAENQRQTGVRVRQIKRERHDQRHRHGRRQARCSPDENAERHPEQPRDEHTGLEEAQENVHEC